MCGILGVVGLSNIPIGVTHDEFINLTSSLQHRGPDYQSQIFSSKFYFGHTRLSINDLSITGIQPMYDRNENICITFNGEIYNFLSLKKELISKGHEFKSATDTEVIIEAYKEWGINCIHKFDGMFAFALFDKRKEEVYLVRDRLGIKPLYYSFINGSLVFSSELHCITNYPGLKKELNYESISCYLSYRHVLGEKTYFENIFQLEPGFYYKHTAKEKLLVRYWDINLNPKKKQLKSQLKKELKALIHSSVESNLAGDVEVGTLLSGGLDSSIILASASNYGKKIIKSFTACFQQKEFNETKYASLVASKFNSDNYNTEILVENYIENLKAYILVKDQPIGMHNEVSMYLLSKEVKKHVSVVLSGEGADEIFNGYGRLFRSPFNYHRSKILGYLPGKISSYFAKRLAINLNWEETEVEHFMQQYSYFPLEEKLGLFNKKMKQAVQNDNYSREIILKNFQKASHRKYYDKLNYIMVKLHLPGLLLMMDSTTMAWGLELRVPFLNHDLVQKTFTIPHYLKLKWRTLIHHGIAYFTPAQSISENLDITKSILKDIYSSYLPKEIISRDKMGFPVPLSDWFKNDFNELIKTEVLHPNSRICEFFDLDKLKLWFEENTATNDPDFGKKAALILNLELWLRAYA